MSALLLALDRDSLGDWFGDHGSAVIGTVVLTLIASFAVGRIVPAALRPAITRQMGGRPQTEIKRRVDTLSGVIVRTVEFLLLVFALLTVLPEFGMDIRALIAGVSISSIAIGFGAQSLVKDALTGIFILVENQYAIGDIVTISGVTGTVEDITLRRTLIRDLDGVLYTVPNGNITTTANFTRDFSKVRVTIPVAPSSDLVKVQSVANAVGEALAKDPEYAAMILAAPQYLRIDNIDMMGGVAVQVNGTVVPGRQWDVAGVLRARLLEAFQREGIKTPWG
jgi:moderate conductance mechanosensitive channel